MKCLRCEGTGIDPQAEIWDDSNYNSCVECYCGDAEFSMWLRQVWDWILWKLRLTD